MNILEPPKFDQPANEKLIAIISTSRSTGLPKLTTKTHAIFLGFSKMTIMPVPYKSLNFSLIVWASGFLSSVMVALRPTECKVQTIKHCSPEMLLKLVEEYKVTMVFLSPVYIHEFLESSLSKSIDFQSAKILASGGATISGELTNKFQEKFPKRLLMSSYSLTEASVALLTPGKVYINEESVGNLLPNVVVKIVDYDGNKLGVREQGEVLTKSRLFPFACYYNHPDATQKTLDSEGFIKTGDIGFFEEDNTLVIVNRKNEIFNFKTYEINPKDIEDSISLLDGVAQVSVVGIPDKIVNNLATAVIVKKTGFEHLTEQVVADHIANHFPAHKHLHGGVVFMDSLPMTASGKVLKLLIPDELTTKD